MSFLLNNYVDIIGLINKNSSVSYIIIGKCGKYYKKKATNTIIM